MSKRNVTLIALLGALAALAGYWMSKIPWYGKWGMNLFYKEYTFLKTWWKGGLIVFAIWLIICIGHSLVKRKASKASALAANLISLIIAIGGLYFTYLDFRNDFTHNIMGERFHLGFYLFWLGWMAISTYFLAQKSSRQLIVTGKAD